jgi:hypothetical protein
MTEPAGPGADWQRQPYRRLLALATAMATDRTLTDLLQDLAGQLQGFLDFQSLGIMLYDGARHVMRWHLLETSAPTRRPLPQDVPLEGSMAGGGGVVLPSCLHGKSVYVPFMSYAILGH